MAKKPGKYEEVIKGLPRLPDDNPSYQREVNERKDAFRAEGITTPDLMAERYKVLRSVKDDLEEEQKQLQKQITALEQMLSTSKENEDNGWGLYGAGPNAIKLPDGSSITVQPEPTGKVEDKEKFRLWCIANGLENSLQLWPSTMNAITKERLLAGEAEPDGVAVYYRDKIVLRKG